MKLSDGRYSGLYDYDYPWIMKITSMYTIPTCYQLWISLWLGLGLVSE